LFAHAAVRAGNQRDLTDEISIEGSVCHRSLGAAISSVSGRVTPRTQPPYPSGRDRSQCSLRSTTSRAPRRREEAVAKHAAIGGAVERREKGDHERHGADQRYGCCPAW